jgi:hypothetical protein
MDFSFDLGEIGYVIEIILTTGILIIYSLNLFWSYKIFKISRKYIRYTYLYTNTAIVSIGFLVAFSYLLIDYILGRPLEFSPFGVIILRPLILLMGFALASNSRTTLTLIQKNGEKKE